MHQQKAAHHLQLFPMRVWREDLGDGQGEWRGNVRQVTSGEACSCRAWPQFIPFLMAHLGGTGSHQI